jgi:hypothetical protein
MRLLLPAFASCLVALPAPAAVLLEGETKSPYQLRIVVRTGDHPALTKHFRAEVIKSVGSALQSALGPLGTVEVVDLNTMAIEDRDPLCKLVDEKGLESLDTVTAGGGGKTHFVFVDFADGKYEIRTRQHDGSTGFSTPIIRKTVHGDRGFIGRLAGLSIAQDFGVVGTFDVTGPQITVFLKAGELGAMDPWVKKGDVFAVVHVREGRRAVPKTGGKARAKEKESTKADSSPPPIIGTRVDGVLLQVVDGPREGLCVCKMYNRYRGALPRDASTLGYRAVRLGTGEGPVKLQLTDGAGTTFRADTLQPRAGVNDFPDAHRDREEMIFSDGVFTSRETFKNIAFVMVKAGETPIARLPIEIYPDRVAVRKVTLNPAAEPSPAVAASMDMAERVRSARVMQARAFDEVTTLQQKEKPKALEYGQAAYDSLFKEAEVLRADLKRLRERFQADAPGLFDQCDADLRTLEGKTKELRGHLAKLKDVIKIENDPATVAARKTIEGLLLDAQAQVQKADLDKAIAKYEEALKLATAEPKVAAEIEKALAELNKIWTIKSPEHEAARKFIYETWAKLEQPADVKTNLPEARKAYEACKKAGDSFSLLKIHVTGPELFQRYADNLKRMLDEATEDEDKKAIAAYEKVTDDLQKLLTDVAKTIGVEAK